MGFIADRAHVEVFKSAWNEALHPRDLRGNVSRRVIRP